MTVQDTDSVANSLFEKLQSVSSPPDEHVFADIEKGREAIIPHLLQELRRFAENPQVIRQSGPDYIRHVLSIFLLAYFRETRAYPLVVKLISRPGDEVVELTGEVFTEALGRILASLYDGDLKPVQAVIENEQLNPWIRSAALDTLMVLWKEDVLEREQIIDYLKLLMQHRLQRRPGYVWDSIALLAYDLHPGELADLLRAAIRDRLIAPMVLNARSLKQCLASDVSEAVKNKKHVVDGYIKEPVKELTWWLYPDEEALEKGMEYAALAVPVAEKKVTPGERVQPVGWRGKTPVVNPVRKVGRNEPCPCGSGRKYKKCCALN